MSIEQACERLPITALNPRHQFLVGRCRQ